MEVNSRRRKSARTDATGTQRKDRITRTRHNACQIRRGKTLNPTQKGEANTHTKYASASSSDDKKTRERERERKRKRKTEPTYKSSLYCCSAAWATCDVNTVVELPCGLHRGHSNGRSSQLVESFSYVKSSMLTHAMWNLGVMRGWDVAHVSI